MNTPADLAASELRAQARMAGEDAHAQAVKAGVRVTGLMRGAGVRDARTTGAKFSKLGSRPKASARQTGQPKRRA